MDKSERARLRALCEAATPGPWRDGAGFVAPVRDGSGTFDSLCECHGRNIRSNAVFVAASRTAIPALLDDADAADARAEKAERERDDARALLSEWRKLIVDTAAALGQTMPPCVWHDHGNIARLAADVVRERDEARGGRALAEELACAIGLERDLLRRERDEACAEAERLRAEVADHHAASVLPRETALRETAEALGFTHMGAQGFAGMAHRHRDAAVAAEREACAAMLDERADDLDIAESYLVDDDRDEERQRVHERSKELRTQARAIRARGAGGAR